MRMRTKRIQSSFHPLTADRKEFIVGRSQSGKKSRLDLQPHYIEWGLTALGVIVACVLVVFVLFRMTIIWGVIKKFFSILSPFIYGFVMAYLLMPVFNMLYRNLQPPMSRKFKNGTRLAKGLCSALTLAFGLAVVGVLLWMVLPQLVTSITSLVDSMDLYMNEISGWVASLLHNNPELEHSFMRLYDQFSAQMMNWAQNDLLPQLGSMMSGVVTTVNVLMNLLYRCHYRAVHSQQQGHLLCTGEKDDVTAFSS